MFKYISTKRQLTAIMAFAIFAGCSDSDTSQNNETGNNNTGTTQEFAACDQEFTLTEADPNRAWTANAVTLASEKLSPGVFAIYDANAKAYAPDGKPVATSGGFVIGDDGVLIVETMINRQLFCKMIELVQKETNKPILYAVNTSHHGDHSYGNAFLPDSVQIVQHEGTRDFITDPTKFAGDIAFMEANFGADQGIDEITATPADIVVDNTGWSIDLGNKKVEAHYLGFGQTEGDLFVYVPDAKVLWTGNAVVARSPAIPWLLDGHAAEVRETLAKILVEFPDLTIVPGHDAPIQASDIQFSVDYLDGLISEVQAAIDAGMTLEETVASVTMEEFQGYALWGFVHVMLNVPVTYAELNQ